MTDEIIKLYENAGIKKDWNSTPYGGVEEYYPTFTAEKQIELIKWLAHKDSYSCNYSEIKPRDNNEEWMSYSVFKAGFAHSFEESLAELIDSLWQDLTDIEKAQIKNILESEVRE